MDQIGRFPVTSSRGKTYMIVMYHYNCNIIMVEPLKQISAADITTSFDKLYTYFMSHGYKPKIHKLDNKAPSLLNTSMRTK